MNFDIRAEWGKRSWWMNLIFLFCLYMTFIYLPFDLVLQARRRGRGSLVRVRAARLVGQGDRTAALADIRRRGLWILEDGALDVAVGGGVRGTGFL